MTFSTDLTPAIHIVMLAAAYLSRARRGMMPFAEQYLRWIGSGYILNLAISTLRADYGFSINSGDYRR